MTTASRSFVAQNKVWIVLPGIALVVLVALSLTPSFMRVRVPPHEFAELRDRSPYGDSHATPLSLTSSISEKAQVVAHQDVADRKMIRTGAIEATVRNPLETAERIRGIAGDLGGWVENSQISGGDNTSSASLTIRVPATRYEDAKSQIRNLGLRIDRENTQAADVTRQYVDADARIRNLRAQEAQYLQILKAATRVKDMLEVSEKLSEVRGEIEQQQAEFQALSRQVDTVALTISLRAVADAEVFGLNWRPLYQIKLAARDALNNLADYSSTMVAIIFEIPIALLWIGTIGFACLGGWKFYRWARKTFFPGPTPATVTAGS
jgi:hypothetical protein